MSAWSYEDDLALALHRARESFTCNWPLLQANQILLDVAAGRAAEAFRRLGDAIGPYNIEDLVFDEIAFNEIMRSAWLSRRPWKANVRRYGR